MSTSRTNTSPRGYSLDKLQSCQSRVEVLDATNFLPLSDTNPPPVFLTRLCLSLHLSVETHHFCQHESVTSRSYLLNSDFSHFRPRVGAVGDWRSHPIIIPIVPLLSFPFLSSAPLFSPSLPFPYFFLSLKRIICFPDFLHVFPVFWFMFHTFPVLCKGRSFPSWFSDYTFYLFKGSFFLLLTFLWSRIMEYTTKTIMSCCPADRGRAAGWTSVHVSCKKLPSGGPEVQEHGLTLTVSCVYISKHNSHL